MGKVSISLKIQLYITIKFKDNFNQVHEELPHIIMIHKIKVLQDTR